MDWEVWNLMLGYISTPLTSLATKRQWPKQVKFLLAVALAAAGAVGGVLLAGEELTRTLFLSAFGITFGVQQSAWSLDPVGLGSARVNEPLLSVGSGEAEAPGDG